MWSKFNEQSRKAILNAQIEANARGSSEVDTEHLLLGIILESQSAGSIVLREQGVTLEAVQAVMPPLRAGSEVEARLTADAKRVLELTADESRTMRHRFIGTGHMAIALARLKDGNAATILRNFRATPEVLRARFDSLEPSLQIEDAHWGSQARTGETLGERITTRLAKWAGRA